MSYAKVMASLNASSVDVEVKKRAPDGSYVPADGRDFATADFDAELEAAVKAVQRLPRDERLAYGRAMRAEGNAQFARGAHADAQERMEQLAFVTQLESLVPQLRQLCGLRQRLRRRERL